MVQLEEAEAPIIVLFDRAHSACRCLRHSTGLRMLRYTHKTYDHTSMSSRIYSTETLTSIDCPSFNFPIFIALKHKQSGRIFGSVQTARLYDQTASPRVQLNVWSGLGYCVSAFLHAGTKRMQRPNGYQAR